MKEYNISKKDNLDVIGNAVAKVFNENKSLFDTLQKDIERRKVLKSKQLKYYIERKPLFNDKYKINFDESHIKQYFEENEINYPLLTEQELIKEIGEFYKQEVQKVESVLSGKAQKSKKIELTYDNIFKDNQTKKMLEKCLIDLRYIDQCKKWKRRNSTKELGLFIDVMIDNNLHNDCFKKKSISLIMSQKYIGIEIVKYSKLTNVSDKNNILDSIKQAINTNRHKI